jgi:hypothetical protein
MIRVTPPAVDALRRLARPTRAPDPAGPAIRLDPDGRGGLSMAIGAARPGDLVAADEDGPALILAAVLARPLDGLVFDVVAGQLTFRSATDEEPADLLVAAPEP